MSIVAERHPTVGKLLALICFVIFIVAVTLYFFHLLGFDTTIVLEVGAIAFYLLGSALL